MLEDHIPGLLSCFLHRTGPARMVWAPCLIWCINVGISLMIETKDWLNDCEGEVNYEPMIPVFPVRLAMPVHFWDNLHSIQQLEEWRRKSFPSKTCPGNTLILKGATFNNEVLWRMGWGKVWLTTVLWLQSIIFIWAWKLNCVQGCVLQKDIFQVKGLKERLAANCSYSHHYPDDCISCFHHSMLNCQGNAVE